MAKKKEGHRIKEVIDEMKLVYEEIEAHAAEPNKETKEDTAYRDDYKYWVIKLIDILEKTGNVNKELYDLIVETHPKIKPTIDDLIAQTDLFTIYEGEPSVANFDFEAYLKEIKEIIEQE